MDKYLKSFLVNHLRRISYRWFARNTVMKAAKVARGKYTCNICQEVFARKNINLDHKIPVIDPIVGFVDWNTFISRLFVDESGWQVICKPCHDKKTQEENLTRREKKDKLK